MRRTLINEGHGIVKPPDRERPDEHGRAAARSAVAASKPGGVFAFRAELDLTEIDARGRPGVVWTGRAVELSRSHLAFRSRRMCYEGRELLLAVHLVDDRPVPLYGMVGKSEYDGDGLYRTTINLLPTPESESVEDWVRSLHARAQP
jgi:hypothetical protein